MRFLARLGTIRTVVALLALSTGLQMAFITVTDTLLLHRGPGGGRVRVCGRRTGR